MENLLIFALLGQLGLGILLIQSTKYLLRAWAREERYKMMCDELIDQNKTNKDKSRAE